MQFYKYLQIGNVCETSNSHGSESQKVTSWSLVVHKLHPFASWGVSAMKRLALCPVQKGQWMWSVTLAQAVTQRVPFRMTVETTAVLSEVCLSFSSVPAGFLPHSFQFIIH
jgi:hypothetical protein